MSRPFTELSQTELDGLIERVEQAAAHDLALSSEDLRLLLDALLMLAQLQERMTDRDITLHKLRKLAGLVNRSEKLGAVLPSTSKANPSKKTTPPPRRESKPAAERVIHERCPHRLEGLEKGQRCPECERGRLYQYDPAVVLRISGQTPLRCTEHLLERLRCNTCGAYFTATVNESFEQDGPVDQRYGYSARALSRVAGRHHYQPRPLRTTRARHRARGSSNRRTSRDALLL